MNEERSILPQGYQLKSETRTYMIDRYVSAGSNSIVYEAHYQDSLMQEHVHTVLIKELYPLDTQGRISRDNKQQLQVKEEGKAFFELQRESFLLGNRAHLTLAASGSDHIAENLDSFQANNTLYTVLTAKKGKVLGEFLKEGEEFPTATQAVVCINNLLTALAGFHNHGLLHLDISPDNIFLLSPEEKGGFPTDLLLLDFNSIYSLEEKSESEYQYYLGKEDYMAPEIFLHQKAELGPWTDLYSVCAVFYEILTGEKLPKDRELERNSELVSPYSRILLHEKERTAEKLNAILRKGLELLPQNRYQDIGEMKGDIQELLGILNGTIRFAPLVPEKVQKKKETGGKWRVFAQVSAGVLAGILLMGGLNWGYGLAMGRRVQSEAENPEVSETEELEDTQIDLSLIPLELDDSVVLTEKNVRWPLEDNILNLQEQTSTSVRVMLKDYSHKRNLEDVYEQYSLFCFYSGKGDKRGWQYGDRTYDFFRTEDNALQMVLPFQDTNDFDLSYIGVVFANYNYDKSTALLDITSCTLTDGEGNRHEITDLIGSHLLYFDEENWQWNLTTDQNQDFVTDFGDIYGGNLTVDAQVGYLEPVVDVKWESEDPDIARVDPDGRITAVNRGYTTLTVTLTDKETGETKSTQMIVNIVRKPI